MDVLSDLLGRELPPNILDLLIRRMVTVVVATVDGNGCPHTAPYNQITAVTPKRLRLAVNRQDDTFRALCDSGRAMIAILEEGDIAAGIKGSAHILRESMETNCNLALMELEIEEIKRDNSPYYVVTQGVRTRHRDEPFLIHQRQVMAEIRS